MALGGRLLLGLSLLAALTGVLLQLYRLRKPRLWTLEELSAYNGTDEGLPILLGILGSVFDVTKGRSHYGPGGGYHHFSGRSKPSLASVVACMMPFMMGVCFLCPSMDCLWHKYHYCPSCGEKVAEFKKDDPCIVVDPTRWTEPSFAVPA